MRPRLTGLPYLADRATRLGGLPHLSCKQDQIKMRDYMERRVTPLRRVTSPTWGPPPPCKQALNLHINKATKTRGDKQLFNHTFYETNFKPKLFTANVECNGTVIKLPKTEKPILFLNFKFSLNGGDLVFWFTFNFAA